MNQLSRRVAVHGICSGAFAALLSRPTFATAADDKGKSNPKRELIGFGPYRLGEAICKDIQKALPDWFVQGVSIRADDLIKAFNETEILVVDERIRDTSKGLSFSESTGAYPAAVVRGKFVHEWQKGEYSVQVVEIRVADIRTSYRPKVRYIGMFSITLRISKNGGLVNRQATIGFAPELGIKYDVDGNKVN